MAILTALHRAIQEGITAGLPGVFVLPPYPDLQRALTRLPAIDTQLTDLEPGDDPGSGEAPLIGRFTARVIVDPNLADAGLSAREMAARLAALLYRQTWGMTEIGYAHFVQAGEDALSPDLDGYLVWMVEWTHAFYAV
ncbi:MAG: hypothetical protein LBD68_09845 [Zoogloeaceae bacterium]|jgi:hypothetical protein|nr:hypothetical protein [Zoogloeaceae bacterium]